MVMFGLFNIFKKSFQQATEVRDEIIDFAVGFYQQNPEQLLDLEHILLLARTLRNQYEKQGRLDMVGLLDEAVERFSTVRWLYVLTEVSKRTGVDAILK
jgi:hypothetical protein